MFAQIRDWYHRNFSDPQVVILAIFLILGLVVVLFFGRMLAPVLASIVIAYLLEGAVQRLQRFGLPRLASVIVTFVGFMLALIFLLFAITPMITRQLGQVLQALPEYARQLQTMLARLPEEYPQFVSEQQINQFLGGLESELANFIRAMISIDSVLALVALIIFLVLMPILVFFMLKDKDPILNWFRSYMPRNRGLTQQVWAEVDQQIGNYVRGKVLEIIIVWAVTYAVFMWLGLDFALLLSVMVGLSVIIPFIGAAVVTVPVALVALLQFGISAEFMWVLIAYAIIQFLDGNVLVPLLFSEVNSLHPVAIIAAVLLFGGIWGFWGVFFAIPLATLVNAVLRAWPRERETEGVAEAEHA